eukprot:Sdes_comp15782_c0_seq1m4847
MEGPPMIYVNAKFAGAQFPIQKPQILEKSTPDGIKQHLLGLFKINGNNHAVKLRNSKGNLVVPSQNLPANSEDAPYTLEVTNITNLGWYFDLSNLEELSNLTFLVGRTSANKKLTSLEMEEEVRNQIENIVRKINLIEPRLNDANRENLRKKIAREAEQLQDRLKFLSSKMQVGFE